MESAGPVALDLVLLGGGHSHVIALRRWAMNPVPGVRVTLISPDSLTAYSGMLPGLIAGHYAKEEAFIDLSRLCRWANACFIRAAAGSLDVHGRRIHFNDRYPIEYDLLSVNIGGEPRPEKVVGKVESVIPVKPVHSFLDRWHQIKSDVRESREPLDLGVVGAGAGGFETLLAMNHALNAGGKCVAAEGQLIRHRFHWFIRDEALTGFPDRVRRMALEACTSSGVKIHHGFDACEYRSGSLISTTGKAVPQDATVWCVEAMPAAWVAQSGLDCDDHGFIRTDDTLQSVSHPEIFAVGDIAMQVNHPRPRAGVFAVRQGSILIDNLRRAICGEKLKRYRPQERFLTLLSTGDQHAIGNKGLFSVQGKWVWRWKHWVDSKFVRQFNELPLMPYAGNHAIPAKLNTDLRSDSTSDGLRCAGCGSKLENDVLDAAIEPLKVTEREDMPVGLSARSDVAVIQTAGKPLSQSVDHLRSFLSDPWLFGRIATNHALSDLYASGSEPQSAMVMVTVPWGSRKVIRRELSQLMEGVDFELKRVQCALTGGHSSEGPETTLGFVVNGYPAREGMLKNTDIEPGDRLILTKPLGTGVILAADMRHRAKGPVVDAALDHMLQSNSEAARIIADEDARCMTDVTGFGLLGHLSDLLKGQELSCHLSVDAVPALPGALSLFEEGFRSSLHPGNERTACRNARLAGSGKDAREMLLMDPQTSGGLLAVVPAKNVDRCLDSLFRAGYGYAACIGMIVERSVKGPLIICV